MTVSVQAHKAVDLLVVGAGFYGGVLALDYKNRHPDSKVLITERENAPMRRASLVNQARVHNGYHYPRSFTTGYRSRLDFARFVQAWPEAIHSEFTKLYAISRLNSKVTTAQFRRHCEQIGAELKPASASHQKLFNPRLISEAYEVREYAFDAAVLARSLFAKLQDAGVEILYEHEVNAIYQENSHLLARIQTASDPLLVSCKQVKNCTYSGLTHIEGLKFPDTLKLKHEITEMGLMQPPPELAGVGITVMDGPFFSFMPYPAEALHSLSHVRYTPHLAWQDTPDINPYRTLAAYQGRSRVSRMVRDAARYVPAIADCHYSKSIWEVKTVLMSNELDDGRPILELSQFDGKVRSCLGGKIDNIFELVP